MRVTIEPVGPDIADVVARQVKVMTAANKKVGNAVKKAGVAALKSAIPVKSFGTNKAGGRYPLKIVGKIISAGGDHVDVRFQGSPVGFWVILDKGRRGGYMVKPKNRQALSWNGETAASEGHMIKRGVAGRGYWSNAEPALKAAVKDAVVDTYDAAVRRG